jgi:hypothetical protein
VRDGAIRVLGWQVSCRICGKVEGTSRPGLGLRALLMLDKLPGQDLDSLNIAARLGNQ